MLLQKQNNGYGMIGKKIYRPRQEWFKHKDPFVEYDFITPGDGKESP